MITKALQHFHIDHVNDDLTVVSVNVADRSVNVFHESVIVELEQVVSSLETQSAGVIVFRSSRESGFFAGADVHEIASLSDASEIDSVLLRGQQLFERVERLPVPTIAAIHGPCLGGGLEFALACRSRIALNSRTTRLGLPEVQLGLIPGWGGTQRLPALIGIADALPMILQGKKLSAAEAEKIGLVDAVFEESEWEDAIRGYADGVLRDSARVIGRTGPARMARFLDSWLGRWAVLRTAESKIRNRIDSYPALAAAIRSVRAGYDHAVDGYKVEREEFNALMQTSTCRNLLELFLRRERARAAGSTETVADESTDRVPSVRTMNSATARRTVRNLGVVGAGAMGAGIGQLAALKGMSVVLKELTPELAAAGLERVTELLDSMRNKGKLSADERNDVLSRIRVTDSFDDLAHCDAVIEAVVEKMDVKKAVFAKLDAVLRPDAIIASNTSALSLREMSESLRYPDRAAGLHFFNPVHRMELVEVVRAEHTSSETVSSLVQLARALGRTPVVTSDSPGFFVNRVLFPYIGEAVRLILEGEDCRKIDHEAKKFGMPMGPVELVDHVGIDVAWHVAETLRAIHPESDRLIHILGLMVARGWLGMKSGRGFYVWKGRVHSGVNPDLKLVLHQDEQSGPTPHRSVSDSGSHPTVGVYSDDGLTETQRRLVYPMINEAAMCLEEGVIAEPWMADLAMVLGTGFAPFRGGPISVAESIPSSALMNNFHVLSARHGSRFRPASWLVNQGQARPRPADSVS